MQIVTFDPETGLAISAQPVPAGHLVTPDDGPINDNGRRLALVGGAVARVWDLRGWGAFGGLNGRTRIDVPAGAEMIGIGWDDLAAMVSDANPFGILQAPRPETPEEAEAREAEAAAAAEAAEAQRIAGLIVSDRQFAQAVANLGWITRDEAIEFVSAGALPAALAAGLAALPADQRFAVEIKLRGSTEFHRSAPETNAVGQIFGKDADDLDEAFELAATL